MPLKTLLFLIFLTLGCALSIFVNPFYGVVTYLVNYNISPAHQWWGRPLAQMGLQFSKIAALALALGILFHRDKIYTRRIFSSQEWLMLIFVLWIWITHFLGLPPGPYTTQNAEKMTKIFIFLVMFSHVVFSLKRYEQVLWVLIILGLYQGVMAFLAPPWAFHGGRLNVGVGGPDFREGNFLGAHFAMLLPFIGVFFLLNKSWLKRIFLIITAIFVVNAIVLIRSRGVFLATAMGAFMALIYCFQYMKKYRLQVFGLITFGILGMLYLTDPGFWARMSTMKTENPEQIDLSAKGRLLAWKASLKMVKDYPLGIGEGNFRSYVERYNPLIPGKDTHNTYLRCLAELGIPGFLLLLSLIINAFCFLRKSWILSHKRNLFKFQFYAFGLSISIIIFLVSSMFITETYIEEFYFLLFLPLTLYYALENELQARNK